MITESRLVQSLVLGGVTGAHSPRGGLVGLDFSIFLTLMKRKGPCHTYNHSLLSGNQVMKKDVNREVGKA